MSSEIRLNFSLLFLLFTCLHTPVVAVESRPDNTPPPGFKALFNGKDLSGWKGLVKSPKERAKMSPEALAGAQEKADRRMREHWKVVDGTLVFSGKGDSLCTAKDYADFEFYVDWKILEKGDSGIYLRGSPQVQIWDPKLGNVGSGGLFNNQRHASSPSLIADRPVGEWNTFRIIMIGERVTVYLNDKLVVNDVPLENYWERDKSIYPSGQIELQNHGNTLYFKNVYLREIPRIDGRLDASELLVKKGDRVAVVGDSITEQKLYSRFIEDYLVACVPQYDLRVAQFGWGGERAPGFEARMENDLSGFRPDIVTTCYGMNDASYRAYTPEIGKRYLESMQKIVKHLVKNGVKVVVGSPGAVDSFTFRGRGGLKAEVYNENLAQLRDIARDIAIGEGQPFANVFDPMINAQLLAKPVLGKEYHVCGPDGFHPRPNGHILMAYSFLRAMGFDGDIGTITVNMKGHASASDGHEVVDSSAGSAKISSSRYPFCFYGDGKSPDSTRSILPFTRFNEDLNRLTLRVENLEAKRAEVQWGDASKIFDQKALAGGINLAAEFLDNPFSETFAKIDVKVAEKQAFETSMIKECVTRFRVIERLLGDNVEAAAAVETLKRKLFQKDEEMHRGLRRAIVPVTHSIRVIPR